MQCPGPLGPCRMLPAGSLAASLSVQLPFVPDRCPGLTLQLERYFWALQNAFRKPRSAQIHQKGLLLLVIKSPQLSEIL